MSPDLAKVLLIEDEPEIRRFLRASLLAHGYHLTEEETGLAGLTPRGIESARCRDP